ncbi:MAG: TrkH family potassium uptake protein [Clostridia bacterium]
MDINGKFRFSSWQIIALGYLVVIALGSFLLALPFASKTGTWTPYINSLFTATSATCVTGLVVYDTFAHWTIFGQIVILLMIQIGGIGFMTVVTLFAIMIKRKIGIFERKVLMESAGTMRSSGVVRLIKRILIGTFIIELIGAILLMTRFIPQMGWGKGIYYAIFHSVSSFCNAGFDIMGFGGEFSSLTAYSSDLIVNITVMSLIILGGLGFIVWSDIIDTKGNIKKFQLHTKVVLVSTALLIVSSALLFFIFEKNNILAGRSVKEKILVTLFSAITPRTAGFNTVNTAMLTDSSKLLTMVLMFIGGSSGSTAGGIKITTFVVIILGIIASTRNNSDIVIGKRRLEPSLVNKALAIFASYLVITLVGTIIICAIEPFGLTASAFEVISAVGTVGLSTGITPYLSVVSKLVITITMFAGRVGVLNLVLAISEKRNNPPVKKPLDKILIG